MMQKPCPHCHVLIPATLSRCPNCGAGQFVPTPLHPPPVFLTGQSWLDVILGLALSLIMPAVWAKIFLTYAGSVTLGWVIPGSWWLGTVIAYFAARRRYRMLASGLLMGALLWFIVTVVILLGMLLILLGFLAICSNMK